MEKVKKLFSEHLEFIVVLLVIMGTFLWGRAESRADFRDVNQKIIDFHGRLYTLEERYLQLIQNRDKQ